LPIGAIIPGAFAPTKRDLDCVFNMLITCAILEIV
jgi:hypothetical protein